MYWYSMLVRSTYDWYNLHTYFMTISIYVNTLWQYYCVETALAPTRVTNLSGFHCLLEFLEIYKKFNKSVKNCILTNFESVNLFKRPRGIQKCNKKGCSTDSSTRYGFWRKSLTNRSGVFYLTAYPLCGNKKLPPSRIPTVGIVQKLPSTTNTTIHKHHHHGGVVCPSYDVGSMDQPDLMLVTCLEGVGQERFAWV
jgi:hypothetical protein